MDTNKVYKMLAFLQIENGYITFASPYMNKILKTLIKENTVEIKREKKKYIAPHYSYLVHSDVAAERNKTAVEIVVVLVTLLHQRGEDKKKGTTTAHISISEIIDKIPLLNEAIDEQKDTSNKNKILKRAFTKAYELLKTKTDVYEYFIDFKISEIMPTISTIDDVIKMIHKGVNKNYKND